MRISLWMCFHILAGKYVYRYTSLLILRLKPLSHHLMGIFTFFLCSQEAQLKIISYELHDGPLIAGIEKAFKVGK